MQAKSTDTKKAHWPPGSHGDCACPHCGHIDQHQISNVREWGLDCRDGACSACLGEYIVTAKDGVLCAEKMPKDAETFLVHHRYDIGDQGVTIRAPQALNARRAAIYMQFWAEEWFGVEAMVTNLGIAAALVTFYGCKHAARNQFGETINMHDDRETACPEAASLKGDASLKREGLREFLEGHVHS